MIQIPANTYTAITWTGTSQLIAESLLAPVLIRAYAKNPVTQSGYFNYIPSNKFPSLTRFEPGINYLVYLSAANQLASAQAAPANAFPAFPGYTPPAGTTPTPTPTAAIPGTVNSQVAAQTIIGGTLVARVADGVVPYSTKDATQRYKLFGFALNSAMPGETVQVQRNGYVTYPGLGLIPGATLLAGENGRLVYDNTGMAIHHVVGRAETDDSFSFSSSYTTIKIAD